MEEKRDWQWTISKILIYGGIITIVMWALGKSFGLINTPLWIEMLPIFAGAITLLGFASSTGKFLQRMTHLERNMEKIEGRLEETRFQFSQRIDSLTERVIKLEIKSL